MLGVANHLSKQEHFLPDTPSLTGGGESCLENLATGSLPSTRRWQKGRFAIYLAKGNGPVCFCTSRERTCPHSPLVLGSRETQGTVAWS